MNYILKISLSFIVLALISMLACERNSKESPSMVIPSHEEVSAVNKELADSAMRERLILSSESSLFSEFQIENKFQYFELLSHKDQPLVPNFSIQNNEERISYNLSFDRSCMLEYNHKTKMNKLFQSTQERGAAGLKLSANNPEFDKLTIPISMEEGILHFDRVKGVEIYKQQGEAFVKTWTHLHRDVQSKPSTRIIYNIADRRIEYFDKDLDSGNILVKTIDFYDDEVKASELSHGARRITYLPSANLYLSILEDYILLHKKIPIEESKDDLEKFRLPHYPGEMAIYNNRNFQKDLSLKFGHEIDMPTIGFKADESKEQVIRGIYTHKDGLNSFSIVGDQIHLEVLKLAENESKTSRLFATKDFVGSVIYETNTPGQYSNETKISNLRLLIYSFASNELIEVPLPEKLQIEYDVIIIEDVLYLFNKDSYYKFDLSYEFIKKLDLVKSTNSSTSF